MKVVKVMIFVEIDKIYYGDCLRILREMPDNIADAVITDPLCDSGTAKKVCRDYKGEIGRIAGLFCI